MVRTKDMLGLPEDNVAMIPVEGEVLALLTPVDDLHPGLYMIDSVEFGWASLRLLIDDIENEKLIVTEPGMRIPTDLLELFARVGINLMPTH